MAWVDVWTLLVRAPHATMAVRSDWKIGTLVLYSFPWLVHHAGSGQDLLPLPTYGILQTMAGRRNLFIPVFRKIEGLNPLRSSPR